MNKKLIKAFKLLLNLAILYVGLFLAIGFIVLCLSNAFGDLFNSNFVFWMTNLFGVPLCICFLSDKYK